MGPFNIFNTLTRRVERFEPLKPPAVTLYSCGPTVYLPQHLGNMRAYLFVDTLRRALRFHGYDVRHVMNITDVGHMTSDEDAGEDKIEKTARAEGKSPQEVADFYIAQFRRDCGLLNIELPPDAIAGRPAAPPQSALCRATDNIGEMIALIERIIAHGFAYPKPSGIYFDVERWRGAARVGRLSRQSLDEQHTGQRLEHSPDKKSPHDFALWVLNQPGHLMQWDSPWGRGYPGWHIECSAMSMKYLGETIDIHTGGLDHIPIHHENEIAQSESATAHPFVRYFVHNAFLVGMEGAKISKSAGKFPLVADLVKESIDPLAFRLFCFGAKYRSELAFSLDAVRAAKKNLDYFQEFASNLPDAAIDAPDSQWVAEYEEKFQAALADDLNTPRALAVALELVHEAYTRNDKKIWPALKGFDSVMGLKLADALKDALAQFPAHVLELKKRREEARAARDFKQADDLRKQLSALGYEVKDTSGESMIQRRRNP
ncbi:MAG TPA: cysteine--tRNA ligase [Candidatus Binataceae bacterium]|nr:cysteine--tRNA ligase [Candidatus Binataceae bacterium]